MVWVPPPGHPPALLQLLSLACVTCLVLVCCVPPLHKPLRQRLRPWVLFHVQRGLERVVWLQQFENAPLTALFIWSSHTVSVPFYVTFLPCLSWVAGSLLCYRLAFLMTLSLYVGNGLKDLVCTPRPLGLKQGARKARLLGSEVDQSIHALEYGLPSSHTMNSLSLNLYLVHWLLMHQLVSGTISAALFAAAGLWVCWIGISRLYLGFHTPVDVLIGALAGGMVLISYVAVDELFDRWMLTSPTWQVVTLQVLVTALFLRLHPKPMAHTPSYEYTVSFAGVCSGLILGVSRTRNQYLESASIPLPLNTSAGVLFAIRRLMLGFAVIAVLKEVSKKLIMTTLPYVYQGVPLSLRRLWQPPVHTLRPEIDLDGTQAIPVDATGRAWDVSVTARFLSYATLGWAVIEFCPWLFLQLKW